MGKLLMGAFGVITGVVIVASIIVARADSVEIVTEQKEK